jgi:threonine/homoserine/homoserine lactone efflux protein
MFKWLGYLFAVLLVLVAIAVAFFAPLDDLYVNGRRGGGGDIFRGLVELVGPMAARYLLAALLVWFAWLFIRPTRKSKSPADRSSNQGKKRR